jgi:hypothetical protein
LKKRSKKLLSIWYVPRAADWAPMDRSFLLLFFKKEALAFFWLADLVLNGRPLARQAEVSGG